MMSELIVREATAADSKGVEEVTRLATADLRKVYESTLAEGNPAPGPMVRLVAELDGLIVGTVRYRVEDAVLRVVGVMVHPSHRRQGIARAMVDELAAIASKHGLSKMSLHTICQIGNVEVFRKMGFGVVSEAPARAVRAVSQDGLTEAYMERLVS